MNRVTTKPWTILMVGYLLGVLTLPMKGDPMPSNLIALAKQVYGEHTEWKGVQLARLELLAKKIIEAHEAEKKKEAERAQAQ